ncbi:DUF3560 domain-containing protein [Rodentibacter myodis]|uniref:DUF3560 domain-containing protein n=1 Tax=Rodentibacter myodis TaxID=1907939 RepID=A0A1V3JSG6_9PAST|nr:DUF3560 domain-containing protein [Rodentibacter myodis]OOF59744.1 hypothetical protein BKL49_02860 [Rodentibacter myodis]
MNTYAKFAPNVFVAKCPEAHNKGDIIVLTSRYGKEVEVEIHNLVKQNEEYYFYSFVRCDGIDSQKRAEKKAQHYQDTAHNAMKRSHQFFEAAQEGREFLCLGEPIKVGHHSEKRHRALLERNHRRMEKSVEERQKAESYDGKIAYWESRADKIDLSMPESLEFFQFELAKAKEKHQELKANPEKREHSFSLTYAKKAVNELEKKVKLAEILWA